MNNAKPSDCLLFIDDEMARFIIAWNRMDTEQGVEVLPEINCRYSPKKLAAILNLSAGQVSSLVGQAVAVGIILDGGIISPMAQNAVNALIALRAAELKG